jgi:DNA transposition AAA+ family ATPase
VTATVYPAHYTDADVKLIDEVNAWIAERDYTQAALARLARISTSSLNQIINGVYATPPAKLLANVSSAMRHADEAVGNILPPVETSVFRMVTFACDMARRYRNFAIVSAYVGTGKTFALRHYAATSSNTHVIEASPTMTSASLVKKLARIVVGIEKGSIADKFEEIVSTLKNTDSLIIVDEAETLTVTQLHTIRRIRDMANVGVVFAGTEHLSGLIRPAHGPFDQIRSRVGFWPETARGITETDAAALTQAAFGVEEIDDAFVKRLYGYCKGSARLLVEGLIAGIRYFRDGRALTPDLVDAVAKQALCLQSAG